MDYKEKYEMALERARIWKDKSGMPKDKQGILDDIFPELKESEDEKIRKELITHCRNTRCVTEEGAERIAKWIAWLEKKENKPQGKKALEAIKEEKVDNANKVEPKFNVGDWICNDACVVHIASIKNGMYYFDEGDGLDIAFVDNNYHLWTIKDARDGDVLVDVYGNIGIFEEHDAFGWLAYCSLGCNGGFQNFKVEHENDKTHPATKEQREQLKKAMTDAGYTFDFDKKELKKVEQKPAWSGEDEERIKNILSVLDVQVCWDGATLKKMNPYQKEIDWLQSIKKRKSWKPSDKQIRALRWVLNNIPYNTHKEEISGLLDQIKDL